MELGPAVSGRWPNRILEFRKRCAIDPEFRETLSDYQDAREALERWRAIDPEPSRRIADYVELVHELEAEIDRR